MLSNFTDEHGIQPIFEGHRSYITGITVNSCGYVMQLPSHQQCAFVRDTADCHEMEAYVSYINWVFCNSVWSVFDIVILASWFIFLLLVLLVNVEFVFVPSLMFIANALNMGEFLTGTTLLAIGNGIADLVSSSQKHGGDTEMSMNQMYGTGLFITLCIGGIISCVWPFAETKEYFLWTRAIYVTTILIVFAILFNETVTIWEALSGFILYAIFIAYLVFEHIRYYKKLKAMGDVDETLATPIRRELITQLKKIVVIPKLRGVRFVAVPTNLGRNAYIFGYYAMYLKIEPGIVFKELSWWFKGLYVLTLPLKYVVLFAIPTTMYVRPIRGWCKLAIMINTLFVPPFWLLTFGIKSWPAYIVGFGVSIFLFIVVLFTSRTDRPPAYHLVVAVVAFSTAIAIQYVAASESASVISILFKLSRVDRQTVGITVLTWSNSFGDIISNVYIARLGFQRVAHSACFGGPILNILVGVSLKYTIRSIDTNDTVVKIRSGTMSSVSVAFLVGSLVISGLAIIWSNFQSRRSIGIWMLIVYGLYLLFTLLVELEYIHGYGTDHYDEQSFEI